MVRKLTLLTVVVVLTAGCVPSREATTTIETTTTTPSTTPSTPPSTTPEAGVDLSLSGAPTAVTSLVYHLYLRAYTGQVADLDLPEGLGEALVGVEGGPGVHEVDGTTTIGTILGTQIAVVTSGDDVILAVADPTWRIVGAKLARFGLPPFYGPEPKFLLVVGSDARPGEDPLRSRADSLHVVSLDPSTGQGAIVGIPRDSYVTTPDGLTDKFTSVLSRRGVDSLLATAEMVTSLPIDGYVLTGFAGFTSLVDAFGGFTLDVPFAMSDTSSQAYFQPGDQQMNGAKALAFSRDRHLAGGDFTRSLDQGLVMIAGLEAVQLLGYGRLPALLEMLTANATTDLDAASLLTLTAGVYELDVSATPNVVVDGTLDTVDGADIVRLTDEAYATFKDLSDGTLDQ
jgi:LCP family protein required for cell wall assembly